MNRREMLMAPLAGLAANQSLMLANVPAGLVYDFDSDITNDARTNERLPEGYERVLDVTCDGVPVNGIDFGDSWTRLRRVTTGRRGLCELQSFRFGMIRETVGFGWIPCGDSRIEGQVEVALRLVKTSTVPFSFYRHSFGSVITKTVGSPILLRHRLTGGLLPDLPLRASVPISEHFDSEVAAEWSDIGGHVVSDRFRKLCPWHRVTLDGVHQPGCVACKSGRRGWVRVKVDSAVRCEFGQVRVVAELSAKESISCLLFLFLCHRVPVKNVLSLKDHFDEMSLFVTERGKRIGLERREGDRLKLEPSKS